MTVVETKRIVESEMCFSKLVDGDHVHRLKFKACLSARDLENPYCPILPGLPDDIAMLCLALVPCRYFPVMGAVSKRWRSFMQSKELISVRKESGKLEEWLYVLTSDTGEKGDDHWEVIGCHEKESRRLPKMPGPRKAGYGVVVVNGKLMVMAGYYVDSGFENVCSDVYLYDSCLNRWREMAKMKEARRDFACAEVAGLIYVVGGHGPGGATLSSAEVYDVERDEWAPIAPLRRPRRGCFACGFGGKLYVMGGRSTFTIGNSRFIDVYDPDLSSWMEIRKGGCVMVTTHSSLLGKLFCLEWRNERRISVFDPSDQSWGPQVAMPLAGSSAAAAASGLRFGVYSGKLLVFSGDDDDPCGPTLIYDPEAPAGEEWRSSADLRPSGRCLCTVTIEI